MLQSANKPARILELNAVIVDTDCRVHRGEEIRMGFKIYKPFTQGVKLRLVIRRETVRSCCERCCIHVETEAL